MALGLVAIVCLLGGSPGAGFVQCGGQKRVVYRAEQAPDDELPVLCGILPVILTGAIEIRMRTVAASIIYVESKCVYVYYVLFHRKTSKEIELLRGICMFIYF